MPIQFRSEKKRNNFLKHKWQPFLTKLELLIEQTAAKTASQVNLAQRMPSQAELLQLQAECMQLTEAWYGKGQGNLSVVYQAFIHMCSKAQITFYDFNSLAITKSQDGALKLLDLTELGAKGKDYGTNIRGPFVAAGGMVTRGRSAIDNTVPPNVMLPEQARSYKTIRKYFLLQALKKRVKAKASTVSDVYKNFVTQVAANPGAYIDLVDQNINWDEYKKFKPNVELSAKNKHLIVLFSGIFSKQLELIPRSTMEKITLPKHLTHEWTRLVPLTIVNTNNEIVALRAAGVTECSYLRANEGAYLPVHGMSLSGGLTEKKNSWFWKMQLPRDAGAAALTNEYPDVEKFLVEAELLNPIPSKQRLPGEEKIVVGQNSYTGSSIKQTQHTQQFVGKLEDYPWFAKQQAPKFLPQLGATVDLVQIGNSEDACFIKIQAAKIRSTEILEYVYDIINNLRQNFGSNSLDLQLQIMPTADDTFALLLIPFARLSVNGPVFTNPITGKTNITENVVEHIHLGNSIGNWGGKQEQLAIWKQEGFVALQRLYDFVALPGVKAALVNSMFTEKIKFKL